MVSWKCDVGHVTTAEERPEKCCFVACKAPIVGMLLQGTAREMREGDELRG